MGKLKQESVILPRKNVVWKKLAEEIILLHLESGNYFGLNETGNEFWGLVDCRRSLKEISTLAAKTFGISAETAQTDALDFFGALLKYDLIDIK